MYDRIKIFEIFTSVTNWYILILSYLSLKKEAIFKNFT